MSQETRHAGARVCFQSVPEAATSPHTCASESPLQRRKGTCWAREELRLREVQAAAAPPALLSTRSFHCSPHSNAQTKLQVRELTFLWEGVFSLKDILKTSTTAWPTLPPHVPGGFCMVRALARGQSHGPSCQAALPAAAPGAEADQGMKHTCPSPAVCSPL